MTALPIEHCYWVVPGKVLAGEYPRDLTDAASKLARLTGTGVTAFIDLTEDGELKPYAHLLEGQASHRKFPIPDVSIPHSPELTSAALDAIDDHIRNGEGIAYVHCWGGTGRTGTIIAVAWAAFSSRNNGNCCDGFRNLALPSYGVGQVPPARRVAEFFKGEFFVVGEGHVTVCKLDGGALVGDEFSQVDGCAARVRHGSASVWAGPTSR